MAVTKPAPCAFLMSYTLEYGTLLQQMSPFERSPIYLVRNHFKCVIVMVAKASRGKEGE